MRMRIDRVSPEVAPAGREVDRSDVKADRLSAKVGAPGSLPNRRRVEWYSSMNMCEQAEAFRLLLIMGLASKAEIISWADDWIVRDERPPEWLLDLSLAANESSDVIESKLRDLPCEGDRTVAAYSAIERFADAFRSGDVSLKTAALMLERWAASANVDQDDWTKAMLPIWVADEVEYGYTSKQDVVESISKCLAHFAAVRRAR